jgi:hypothetical protein
MKTNHEAQAVCRSRAAMGLMRSAGTSSGSPIVAQALKILDDESAGSIPWIMRALDGKRQAVMNDQNLSDIGKQQQLRGIANGLLGNVATVAKRVVQMEREHREARAKAVPLPKADAADVLLDLALVQYVKEAKPIPSKLVAMSERVRLAVARTPVELSGITPEVQAQVHGSLMDPHLALQFAEEAQALNLAREVVQVSIKEVVPESEWQARELVESFGTDWQVPGIAASKAERMVAGGPENAAELFRDASGAPGSCG